jgi:hypothetical protein
MARLKRAPKSKAAESYKHPEATSPMRPEVGTQAQFKKKKPPQTYRYGRRFIEWRLALFLSHLQEKQKRQVLDVVAVRQAVIAEDVAVIPELLDKCGGVVGHGYPQYVRCPLRLGPSIQIPLRSGAILL